jgi:hypothetical protein
LWPAFRRRSLDWLQVYCGPDKKSAEFQPNPGLSLERAVLTPIRKDRYTGIQRPVSVCRTLCISLWGENEANGMELTVLEDWGGVLRRERRRWKRWRVEFVSLPKGTRPQKIQAPPLNSTAPCLAVSDPSVRPSTCSLRGLGSREHQSRYLRHRKADSRSISLVSMMDVAGKPATQTMVWCSSACQPAPS